VPSGSIHAAAFPEAAFPILAKNAVKTMESKRTRVGYRSMSAEGTDA
jgi:hypothetical protein